MIWDAAEDEIVREMNDLMISDGHDADDAQRRLSAYYKACMNVSLLDSLGVEPLQFLLNLADSIQSVQDVREVISILQAWNFDTLISLSVEPDSANHSRYALLIRSSGLSLPDFSWYEVIPGSPLQMPNNSQPDAAWKLQVIQTLANDIKKMNMLAGYSEDEAERAVKDTFAIELQLASILSQEPYGNIFLIIPHNRSLYTTEW